MDIENEFHMDNDDGEVEEDDNSNTKDAIDRDLPKRVLA